MVYLLWSRDIKGLYTSVEGIFDSIDACLKYVQSDWPDDTCFSGNGSIELANGGVYIFINGNPMYLAERWNIFTIDTNW